MRKLDQLTTTLDKFLKRLTDIEEEFIFMKEDLKRVKGAIREKLAGLSSIRLRSKSVIMGRKVIGH